MHVPLLSSWKNARIMWMPCCLIGTLTVLSGCVVNEAETPARGVTVNGPPPPAMQEQKPPPPNAQAVWIAGYWHWTGMQYTWIPGHWDSAPPGATWNAPAYSSRDGKYFYESGGWRPAPTGHAVR